MPGPESVRDVLNGESGFFPFDAGAPKDSTDDPLQPRPPGLCGAVRTRTSRAAIPATTSPSKRLVTMLMSNGMRLHGAVRVFRPHGSDRLSDFARAAETFRYLEAENATYIINVHHLVELAEEPPVP